MPMMAINRMDKMERTCVNYCRGSNDESHKFCFLFVYSLGPKMIDPILTFVLAISICIRVTIDNEVGYQKKKDNEVHG